MSTSASSPAVVSAAVSVAPVRVELPSFDAADVDTWLAMCDNLMVDAGLSTQSTMFRKMLAKLPPSSFRLVKHLAVASPLSPTCYDDLKDCLRRRLQLTPATRLQRLEQLPPCSGDRTPSVLFADLDALYPKDNDHEIIKEHFLRRLPPSLQLLCREWLATKRLADVALQADAHFSAHCQANASVSAVHHDSPTDEAPFSSTPFDEHANVSWINRGANKPRGGRAANRGAHYQGPQKNFVDRWCRIHRRYGPAARNCVKPCSFEADTVSGNGQSNRQ